MYTILKVLDVYSIDYRKCFDRCTFESFPLLEFFSIHAIMIDVFHSTTTKCFERRTKKNLHNFD